MMMKSIRRAQVGLLIGLTLISFTAPPSRADLTLSGQIVQISPPASDIQNGGDPQSNDHAFVWSERTNLVLPSNVSVNMTHAGTSNSGNGYNPSSGTVASGTHVDTYIFHSDPVGSATHTYDFTVTSTTAILGIIDTISGLAGTDSLLGSPTTTYPGASTDRALEGEDTLVWGPNNTLTLHMVTSGFVNEFRILVAAAPVPEPVSSIYAATGAAMLLGFAWARRRRP
jgi:hypothetical protein